MRYMKKKDGVLKALILDLRYNGGGSLNMKCRQKSYVDYF